MHSSQLVIPVELVKYTSQQGFFLYNNIKEYRPLIDIYQKVEIHLSGACKIRCPNGCLWHSYAEQTPEDIEKYGRIQGIIIQAVSPSVVLGRLMCDFGCNGVWSAEDMHEIYGGVTVRNWLGDHLYFVVEQGVGAALGWFSEEELKVI